MVADSAEELVRRLIVVMVLTTKEVGRRFHGCGTNWTEVGMVFVDLVSLVMERKPFVYEFDNECLM